MLSSGDQPDQTSRLCFNAASMKLAKSGCGSTGLDFSSGWNCTPTNQRSEEHTSALQSLMRISYAVFCLKKKTTHTTSPLPSLLRSTYSIHYELHHHIIPIH